MSKIKYKKISKPFSEMAKPQLKKSRVSVGLEDAIQEFYFIEIEKLIPFKDQARVHFSEVEIESLADSIKKHGVRQPLTVITCLDEKDKYEVISGERRLRAAKLAGLDKVPCIILQDRSIAQEIAIVENIHREDLHPIELGLAFNVLLEKGIFKSQTQIAQKLAISESSVSEHLKYLEFSEEIKEYLIKNNIKSREKLRKLLKSRDDKETIQELLGVSKKIQDIKNFSVMRVNYVNENLKFQVNGIKKLSFNQKKQLKCKLEKVLELLE